MDDRRVIVGLNRPPGLLTIAREIRDRVYAVKLHVRAIRNPRIIRDLKDIGVHVFLDAKIPEVKWGVDLALAWVEHGAGILSVYAGIGSTAMRHIREAVAEMNPAVEIWGHAYHSELGREEFDRDYGRFGARSIFEVVMTRMANCNEAGVPVGICAAPELVPLGSMSELRGLRYAAVGLRSEGVDPGSQKRVGTPEQVILDGAHYAILESEVADAADPVAKFFEIDERVRAALREKEARARVASDL
jgi:orotidine-5'-phosphate decarboxylase